MVYGDGHYIRTPQEMYEAAKKYKCEESFYNATKIADQCKIELTLGKYESPNFDYTKEDDYEDFKAWQATKYECM
jgi:DNA polymerase III alpha subunit